MCLQYDFISNDRGDGEDCLYLNVYTNNIDKNARNAVMVWIHGGGFYCGCSDDNFYGPDYLMRKDIVLVTINYRVGVFGKYKYFYALHAQSVQYFTRNLINFEPVLNFF